MLRGNESANRIKLSRLIQDLLNFGVMGSLQLWGGGRRLGGCLGAWGVSSTYMCMHTHTQRHVYMYRNCKWLPTWRHPCLACLTCMCMCVCMHASMCVCVHGTSPTYPYPSQPIHPPATPQGWTPGISKYSITLELIKIFQFHLKI